MKTKKLFMMCLLVVAMICACTVHVDALENYPESTTTIFDEGGDYSLYYILNHFNHFVETDVKAGHTIGAVAVGGSATYKNGNGKNDYEQTTSSYLKGNINKIIADGFFKKLYVGEINKEGNYDHQNSERTFISKNDCYINFDDAFKQIKDEVASFTGNLHITMSDIEQIDTCINREHWKLERIKKYERPDEFKLTVDAGYSYEFDEGVISELTELDIMYPSEIDSQTDTMFISNDSGSISMPYIYLNGEYDAINKMGLSSTHEWGEGLSIVTVLPHATEVIDKDSAQVHIGHVVAPNAFVHNMNGDINGCIVSKSLDVNNGESHMWPYKGNKIKASAAINPKPGETSKEEPKEPGETPKEEPKKPGETPKEPEGTSKVPESKPKKESTKDKSQQTSDNIISNKGSINNISITKNTSNDSLKENDKITVSNKEISYVKTSDEAHLLKYILIELFAVVGIVFLKKI